MAAQRELENHARKLARECFQNQLVSSQSSLLTRCPTSSSTLTSRGPVTSRWSPAAQRRADTTRSIPALFPGEVGDDGKLKPAFLASQQEHEKRSS